MSQSWANAIEFLKMIKAGTRSTEAEEQSKKMEIAMQMAYCKQKKDVKGLKKLLSKYNDLLSEDSKEKVEKIITQMLHEIESKDRK